MLIVNSFLVNAQQGPRDVGQLLAGQREFGLKLKVRDWIWVRGLKPQGYGIDRSLTVSGHFPLQGSRISRLTN
jgi:hypothetical protein